MLTLHLCLTLFVLFIASLYTLMSISPMMNDRSVGREQQMHVYVFISLFWNSSFCVEWMSKNVKHSRLKVSKIKPTGKWLKFSACQRGINQLYSQPNLIVTCWGLALNQKAELHNPLYDLEELFISPPIYLKFTLHPFSHKGSRLNTVFPFHFIHFG